MTDRKLPSGQHGRAKATLVTEEQRNKVREFNEGRIKFSFRFFDREHDLFNCGEIKGHWYIGFVDHLKHISEFSLTEFVTHHHDSLRAHTHSWEKASVDGYGLSEDLVQIDEENCRQFSISKANGRVHGFLIDDIFYIVWLDPHHNLYPIKKHGGIKKYKPGMSEYEYLEMEHESLKREYEVLETEHMHVMERFTNPED